MNLHRCDVHIVCSRGCITFLNLLSGVVAYQQCDGSCMVLHAALDPNCRQRRRQQAADAASEQSADDESSLADEDADERIGAPLVMDGPLVDGVQQRHSRRSRLTNGHAASNDSAFADANGDSQRNGSLLPSAQQGATPPKSRRVRLAQVTGCCHASAHGTSACWVPAVCMCWLDC